MVLRALFPQYALCHQGVVVGGTAGLVDGHMDHIGDVYKRQTLVATLPAYLNALTGEVVHVVTVNDYLAKRDSEWRCV